VQLMFLVITVNVSGCYGTHFWMLQYSFLVVEGLISGCYSTCLG
jgi:nitrate reductase NapE component